jgi:hypothetical protein
VTDKEDYELHVFLRAFGRKSEAFVARCTTSTIRGYWTMPQDLALDLETGSWRYWTLVYVNDSGMEAHESLTYLRTTLQSFSMKYR